MYKMMMDKVKFSKNVLGHVKYESARQKSWLNINHHDYINLIESFAYKIHSMYYYVDLFGILSEKTNM